MAWGIWCRVSGGVTGTREAWLKADGKVAVYEDRAAAEAEAAHHNEHMNASPYRSASFSYTVKEWE